VEIGDVIHCIEVTWFVRCYVLSRWLIWAEIEIFIKERIKSIFEYEWIFNLKCLVGLA